MLKDQRELLELFNAHGVEYMVIGGHAVGAHAQPRLTKDLDLLVRNSQENSIRVFRALALPHTLMFSNHSRVFRGTTFGSA